MSTIATDGKTIAADSLWIGSIDVWGPPFPPKLYRVNPNTILGGVGELPLIIEFIEWYKGGRKEKEKPKWEKDYDFQALEWRSDGRFFLWHTDLIPIPWAAPFALGSGARFAITAMHLGKSPREAVETVIELDSGSGAPVLVMSFDENE